MYYRVEVSPLPDQVDARADSLIARARSFLGLELAGARTREVYSIFAEIQPEEAQRLAADIASPVIQRGVVGDSDPGLCDWIVVVGYLPGVTDNVGRTCAAALRDIIDRPLRDDENVFSSIEYLVQAPNADREAVAEMALALLANPLIQSVRVVSREEWQTDGVPVNCPLIEASPDICIETVDLAGSDADLRAISATRTLALTLEEMQLIRDYFRGHAADPGRQAAGLGADPTDAELECLAQTWSEHCKHKIFAAAIDYTDDTGRQRRIDNLYRTCIKAATAEIGERVDWLLSVFKDNAGVIAFDDEMDLVYKAETHNSPSALDPYGGAMTGIVGVNRDPMGTGKGASLLFNVWGYCLGSPFTPAAAVPEGLLHPRRIRDGVHQGVIEGGNQSGIPYGVGWEYFDERYLGKPLVFCGTVGYLPKRIGGEPGYTKTIEPGDAIVMIGGRIGKDGIHGATFSSEELHTDSPVQAVQIGDPITQKMMNDFLEEARSRRLYRFITDNGAGGLSSSVGEMATICGGCRMDLAEAPLKYEGLQPWEILLSEAQERMSLAVPQEHLAEFQELAAAREVEVSVLGEFTDTGVFHVTYGDRTVTYMELEFMHEGLPQMELRARWEVREHPEPADASMPAASAIPAVLRRLNVCSNEAKARQYDHEVKGLSVVKPFVGRARDVLGDAAVFMARPLSRSGVVLAAAVAPRYSDIDTYHMVGSVIDLALRRTLIGGARLDHIAGLDNFCWPDPVESQKTPDGQYKLAQLVRANEALYHYTRAFSVPCISGKDSMKNDSTIGGVKISIPPTLLFSTIGKCDDVSRALTLDAKKAGDLLYVLGETRPELGGSEYYAMLGYTGNEVPTVDAHANLVLYRAFVEARNRGMLHSAHAPGFGGLAVALAKIAIGGRLGLRADLTAIPGDDVTRLFAESNGRLVVTVPPAGRSAFEALMADLPCRRLGEITAEPTVELTLEEGLCALPLTGLITAYTETLNQA